MTLTVLFDLDDTLLATNMGDFLPAYFTGLGKALAGLGSEEQITQQIHFAVQQMAANRDPARFLKDIFSEHFYPPLGTSEDACRQKISAFYDHAFPKLAALVQVKPEARSIIQWCQSQDFNLAIATNPLFPETATRQRITWAGLDTSDFQFFSTYENFHFTKPNLCYYAEVIGRLGWPEGPIVMVGDDLQLDLLPADQMGLHTFWVDPGRKKIQRPHGALSDVTHYLASQEVQTANLQLPNNPEVLLAVLRATPAVMDSWLNSHRAHALHHSRKKGEWSVNEIFWHLADYEEQVYLPQWQQLIENPGKTLPHRDPSQWEYERGYAFRQPDDAFQQFLSRRMASLDLIVELFEQGLLDLSVHHTIFSKATVAELVGFAAKHDRLHLRQCYQSLNF